MKKIFLGFVFAIAAILLVGCGDKDNNGYGLVHKHYVGVASVEVGDDGKITSATLEEYYLPYSLANVTGQTGVDTDETNVILAGSKYYAKYFKVGDILFTGAVVEGAAVYSAPAAGKRAAIDNIEVWVATPANAKTYVDACKADKVYVANADGSKHASYLTYYEVAANLPTGVTVQTGAARFTKSTTGYGRNATENTYRWNWPEAMKEIIEIVKGTDMSFTVSAEANEDGFWLVDDVVTSATLVDFKDYIAVIKAAYDLVK